MKVLHRSNPWRTLALALVGWAPGDHPSTEQRVLRAMVRARAKELRQELHEERETACERDMCGLCTGCVERARYAFERGERKCYCCDRYDGVHGWRDEDGESCQYADTYSEEERAEHMAIGLDRLESEGTTTT